MDRLRLDHCTLPTLAGDVEADVVLFPKGFLPLRRTPGASVVCLHDDIPFRQRQDRRLSRGRRVRAMYFSMLLDRSLRRADRRLFVSNTTTAALTSDGERRNGDAVIGEGISLPRRPLVPIDDRERQAIVFGSAHPHKQIEAGIDLLLEVPGIDGILDRVIVLGAHPPRPREHEPREHGHRGQTTIEVVHRPGVTDPGTLADLIADSRLLIFPSEYEGFGLPPIEAFALGTPAVYRRTAVASELLDGIGGGYDHAEKGSFDAAVATALDMDDDALDEVSAAMWRRFDWGLVAERVAEAMRSA